MLFLQTCNDLYGNNVKWKSNTMMVICVCLTNRFNRHYENKDGCIRKNFEESSFVENTWRDGGSFVCFNEET